MKIAIYSPYLDTAGGGERYMMTIGECLSSIHDVDILLDGHLLEIGAKEIKVRIEKLHGLDLSKVEFVRAPFGDKDFFVKRFIKRFLFLSKYDFLFYLTDGSIFFSAAKNNVIHIQSPQKNTNISLSKKIKLGCWKLVIYNSKFTKNEAEKSWKINGTVIYPPVPVDKIKSLKKEKIILSVGRFFAVTKKGENLYSGKNHKVLIDNFKKLQNKIKGWSLHLAGGTGGGDKSYLEELKHYAKGLDVVFHPDIPFNDLANLYGRASIYWHGAGFGEKDPTKMEHFGISTVEAMAAGCVPIVINLGGQKEIVEQGKSGFLWNNPSELIGDTLKIINDEKLFEKISLNAIKRSKIFSKDKFCQNIKKLL